MQKQDKKQTKVRQVNETEENETATKSDSKKNRICNASCLDLNRCDVIQAQLERRYLITRINRWIEVPSPLQVVDSISLLPVVEDGSHLQVDNQK